MSRTRASKLKSAMRRALFASSVVILFLLVLPTQALAAPRNISGTVKNASNVAISGVTMTLSGAGTGTTTTDASGNYTLNATSSGTYTVTPSKTNYTFSPTSLSYTNLAAHQTAQNYTGTSTITYTISGHIESASAVAISGVTVTLSGGQSDSTSTDASGNYSFAGLPSTNNYTVTPSKTSYTFSPASLTYNNLIANQTSADFTATATVTYTISGSVKNGSNVAINGVTMTLSGGQSATTTTDGSGNYSFAGILPGMDYTVTPTKTSYTFSPTSLSYTNLSANQTAQNFTATATVTYTISGHIENASAVAISGVTMTLSGGQSATTTTDGSGNYSFASILPGMDYTVTPTKTSYTFSPTSLTYTNLSANQTTANFTGASTSTYTISGHIQNASASSIIGVTVTLSGGQSGSTTTDASGNYSFPNLPATNNYTVTPSLANYTFSAPSLTYNNLSANQTTANFTGTSTITYTISGHIQNASGIAISGVTMTLSGGQSGSTTTDASGNYSFTGLPSTNNYTVTPTKTNYTFSPSNRTYNNLSADQTTANFTGTSTILYQIDGVITNGDGNPIPGATVSLSDGKTATTTTSMYGSYGFSSLPSTNNYTVTPSKTNYTFSPVSLTCTNLSSNCEANFTGTTNVTFTISGHIQDGSGTALSGVTVSAILTSNGQTVLTGSTDASGDYSLALDSGLYYNIIPVKTSYTFSPANRVYNNLSADQSTANYTGTFTTYSISGQIYNMLGGAGLTGVTVTLSGGQAGTTTTDGDGYYSFTNLPKDLIYTLTPSKIDYIFLTSSNGSSITTEPLTSSIGANDFGGYPLLSISGHIQDASGTSITGVTVTLTDGPYGTPIGPTTTDASGNYSFANVPGGIGYTVTPSKSGYTFSPPTRTYGSLSANQTAADFTATLVYTISGHIQNASAIAISGVTVTLSGGQTGTRTTDASGNYTFANLPSTSNYTVTPSKLNYTFSPTSLSYNNLSANQTAADFTGTSTITYTISGHIQDGSSASIIGVTVTISGGQSGSTTTDGNGNYSFAGLPITNNYTVTPSKTSYTFSPVNRTYNNLGTNQTTAHFTGTLVTYTISGHIQDGTSVAISGVTVTLSDGQSGSTTTDASGNYSFANLPSGLNYTLTPSMAGFSFSPTSLLYNNLSANQTTADFTGTVAGGPDVTLTASVSPTGSAPPGTDLVYTISFSNIGAGAASAFVITDPIPTNTDFKLGSMTTSLGTTGLTPTSAYSDDVDGVTWTYTPASGAGGAPAGYDRLVKHVRWSFTGSLSPTSPNHTGTVSLTTRIR